MTTRIALIHALAHSVAPINAAFAVHWPEATLMNLLDDSLSVDLASNGTGLDARMHARFATLTDYAVATGAHGVLFTCSAFGPCIAAAAARHPGMPVLKPNEAMIADAVSAVSASGASPNARIGLIASFAPTLVSMRPEFPSAIKLDCELVEPAMQALNEGRADAHDAAVVAAAKQLQARGAAVIALAQFSMARAAEAVTHATGLPVLTTPSSAIRLLQRRLIGEQK